VAALITVLAVMSGFGYELQKRIIGSSPHIIVEKQGGIRDYASVCEKIDGIKEVRGSYPYIWGQGVLRYHGRAQGVLVKSIASGNRSDITKLKGHMQMGAIELVGDGIVLGSELSAMLGAFIGSRIEVITPASRGRETFEVTGIFSSGMYEYDSNMAYVGFDSASRLFGTDGAAGGIGVEADKIGDARGLKDRLRQVLGPGYRIRTWMDLNRNLFSALKLEKFAMFVILTLIVIVAAFNIISTLTVTVTEKAKDIGILKSIGATRKNIMAIFSLQGLIIGFIGVALGVGTGMGLSIFLDKNRFAILPENIYYGINYLPVRIDILDCFVIAAAALLIAFLASIYPAFQASRLNPVDALRYE